jgi:nifR3 family TIM-barrel protein
VALAGLVLRRFRAMASGRSFRENARVATSSASDIRSFAGLLAGHPVVLAPMDDVTDAPFRRLCRRLGAVICVTEFVRAEQLIHRSRSARRRIRFDEDDQPTGIQIYGANAGLLLEAAEIAAAARPAFVDINCGCWVPRVAAKGAGAAWLRDPGAMVEMARRIAAAIDLPVTVKTRIGWGPEPSMPIVDLARRLEDAGVAGLTVHCRTAQMGHQGAADWRWAAWVREAVAIPVLVNGDVRSAGDAARALAETGCAGVMVGRAAIDHPWIFGEARSWLAGSRSEPPTDRERVEAYRWLVAANAGQRGEKSGVEVTRRHLGLLGPRLRPVLQKPLCAAKTMLAVHRLLDDAAAGVAALEGSSGEDAARA